MLSSCYLKASHFQRLALLWEMHHSCWNHSCLDDPANSHDIYQLLYIQSSTSWWWAVSLLEIVEVINWNKLNVNSASYWFLLYAFSMMQGQRTLKLFYLKRYFVSTSQRDVFDVVNTGGRLRYIGCIKKLTLELDINAATCEKAQWYVEAVTCALRFK